MFKKTWELFNLQRTLLKQNDLQMCKRLLQSGKKSSVLHICDGNEKWRAQAKEQKIPTSAPKKLLGIKMKHCNRLPRELVTLPVLDAPGNRQVCKGRYRGGLTQQLAATHQTAARSPLLFPPGGWGRMDKGGNSQVQADSLIRPQRKF